MPTTTPYIITASITTITATTTTTTTTAPPPPVEGRHHIATPFSSGAGAMPYLELAEKSPALVSCPRADSEQEGCQLQITSQLVCDAPADGFRDAQHLRVLL
ncbi:unnamed protein product [Polarella glacialis]|uniref:Uncharacterized protein n=1 Tax=Polarella glacialis TaxID=89957 RepID=A0A813DDZ3_POLGL|nr:unnamed protein product [Polarella glacialis]